jgi:hypothetical protein
MNTAPSVEAKLQRLFEKLCDISTEQMDALDHENFDRLSMLLTEKDKLLRKLKRLHDEQKSVTEVISGRAEPPSREVKTIRDLVRRFQAHEKYVTRVVQQKLTLLASRLKGFGTRRTAARGYSADSGQRSTINISG